MARTVVTPTDVTRAGVALASQGADTVNGNYIDNPDRCIVIVGNGTGSPIVLTIQYGGLFDGLAVAGRTVSIPASSSMALGNFTPGSHYQDADQGRLYLDSASASLTLSAVRFPQGLS